MNTEQVRADFKKYYGALFDLTETEDTWGNPRFKHESVEPIWYGWRDRAALQSQDREDAERYRWLRRAGVMMDFSVGSLHWKHEDRLDEAIDHARRK